jgi:hypothetical protein
MSWGDWTDRALSEWVYWLVLGVICFAGCVAASWEGMP